MRSDAAVTGAESEFPSLKIQTWSACLIEGQLHAWTERRFSALIVYMKTSRNKK
jgi:hypothetical protein